MILPNMIDASWQGFLTEKRLEQLTQIEIEIGEKYNPPLRQNILRFLSTDLSKIKVVWLGQDVYPAPGVSTGRAFEVGNLTSWNKPFRQVSLKNIIRLIHKNTNGIRSYQEIKSFKEIQLEIEDGTFKLKQPKEWFDSLENQGVLFLNTSFTCEVGKPNSHVEIWRSFSQDLLRYISIVNPNTFWFLWGATAIANQEFIEKGKLIKSRHPMMCSPKYEDDFLKSDCFLKTSSLINWLG